MTPLLNGHGETKPLALAQDPLASLAGRLTDLQDREKYAALRSYVHALPPTDEFRQVVDMLGLLSLLAQRVPDALAEFLAELRAQTTAVGEYHTKLDGRLARLPHEIAAGVDASAIATAMSENFRQQLAATGLQDTTALLNLSAKEIKAVATNFAAALKPVTQEYKGISATISAELGKLTAASRHLQEHNARMIVQERSNAWLWQGLLGLVLLLAGCLCGIVLETRQTTDVLSNIGAQLERIQRPPAPMVSPKVHSRKGASR
jgi:hypothetical protein